LKVETVGIWPAPRGHGHLPARRQICRCL